MEKLVCVNCGKKGNQLEIVPVVKHSIMTDSYYEVYLCILCSNKDMITVRHGNGKRELTVKEVEMLIKGC